MARYGSPLWLSLVFALIVTVFCIALASLLPGAGYLIYKGVHPETEFGRIAMVIGLLVIGGPLTIFSWVGSFALWATGIAAAFK